MTIIKKYINSDLNSKNLARNADLSIKTDLYNLIIKKCNLSFIVYTVERLYHKDSYYYGSFDQYHLDRYIITFILKI